MAPTTVRATPVRRLLSALLARGRRFTVVETRGILCPRCGGETLAITNFKGQSRLCLSDECPTVWAVEVA